MKTLVDRIESYIENDNTILIQSPSLFKRSEKKYLINSSIAELLMGQIGFYLPKDAKTLESPFISSIYYDNKEWKCYNDQIRKINPRFKVRFRQYTKHGKNSNHGFLEIKRKVNSISLKDRIKANIDSIESLPDDHIPDEIKSLNRKLETQDLSNIYFKIADEIKRNSLHPVARVSYNRLAFENPDKSLRVTFDSNLEFLAIVNPALEPICPSHKFYDNVMVMEIKYADKMPEWLLSLLKTNKISKQRFSKYCNAINYLYKDASKVMQQNIESIGRKNGLANYGNVKELIFN